MIAPPRWTADRLEELRRGAIAQWREDRLNEPGEIYPQRLEQAMSKVEDLLEGTVDLQQLETDDLIEIIASKDGLDAFRYLASPPISHDDLQVLADIGSLAPKRLRQNPEYVNRLASVIIHCVDRNRFGWLKDSREPTESERRLAVVATATLMACQRVETDRRTLARREQEQTTHDAFVASGFRLVDRRDIRNSHDAPDRGHFCAECVVGRSARGRKADFASALWDNRLLLIECKVSGSSTNSIKRLSNDVISKAMRWVEFLGSENVIPAAMLSGVFALKHLESAQEQGMTLFWAHDPTTLTEWLRAIEEDVAGADR